MEEDSDLTVEELPADEEPSESDVPTDADDTNKADADQVPPTTPPLLSDLFGDRRNWLMWLFAAAVIVGIGIFGIALFTLLGSGSRTKPAPTPVRSVVRTTASATPRPTATRTPTATPTATLVPTPTPEVILMGVRALGELNTVEYNLETVVDKDAQQGGLVTLPGGIEVWKPRLHFLLVAGGRVKAGVDFREMVRYEIVDNKVTVYLPAPRITDYAVDAHSLKLYYIHTSFGLDEEFVIEKYNEAVVEAQDNLKSAALESDILKAAETNAAALVQSLILGLGFSEVEVKFAEPTGDETTPLEVTPELVITPAPFITATPEGL